MSWIVAVMSEGEDPEDSRNVDERARAHEWFDPALDAHVRRYLHGLDDGCREGMYLVEIRADEKQWPQLLRNVAYAEEGQPEDSRNVSYREWDAPGIEDRIFGTQTHATYVRVPDTDCWVQALRALLILAAETYYVGRSSAGVASTVDDHLQSKSGRSMLHSVEPVRFVAGLISGIPEDEKNVGQELTEGIFAENGSLRSLETIRTQGQLVFSPG